LLTWTVRFGCSQRPQRRARRAQARQRRLLGGADAADVGLARGGSGQGAQQRVSGGG
jgi:hypothetical protein